MTGDAFLAVDAFLAGDVFSAGVVFLAGLCLLAGFVTLEGDAVSWASSFFFEGLALLGEERVAIGDVAVFAPFLGVAAFAFAMSS